MGYAEITYQDPFSIFSKEGYSLCRGVFPNGVTNLSPGGIISNTLEIDIHV